MDLWHRTMERTKDKHASSLSGYLQVKSAKQEINYMQKSTFNVKRYLFSHALKHEEKIIKKCTTKRHFPTTGITPPYPRYKIFN